MYGSYAGAFALAPSAAGIADGFLQGVDLAVALANMVGASGAGLSYKLLGAGCIVLELVDGRVGVLQLCFESGFLSVCKVDLALGLEVAGLKAGEVLGLAEGVGAQGTEGGGEGFAVFGVALLGEFMSAGQARRVKGRHLRTSRRRIKSLTTLMMRPMVSVRS